MVGANLKKELVTVRLVQNYSLQGQLDLYMLLS